MLKAESINRFERFYLQYTQLQLGIKCMISLKYFSIQYNFYCSFLLLKYLFVNFDFAFIVPKFLII